MISDLDWWLIENTNGDIIIGIRNGGRRSTVVEEGTKLTTRERRELVWPRYLEGESLSSLGRAFGVDPETIKRDVEVQADIEKNKYHGSDLQTLRASELQRLAKIEFEMWEAWRRSQQDKEVVTDEVGPGGQIVRTITQRAGQAGDPRYMSEITKIIGLRCRILGLEAPTKILSIQIRWDLVSQEQLDRLLAGEAYVRVLDPSQYYLG